MKKLLGILVLGLLLSCNATAKQLSKSPFIPDDVYNQFSQLSKEHKIKFCGFKNYKPKNNILIKISLQEFMVIIQEWIMIKM